MDALQPSRAPWYCMATFPYMVSLEEGQHSGVGGVLLVDLLGRGGAGGRVEGDARGEPPTQVGQEVHQNSPG